MPEPASMEDVLSRGPEHIEVTKTAREALGSIMDTMGLKDLEVPGQEEEGKDEENSSVTPEAGNAGHEDDGGDNETGEEGRGAVGGDSEERRDEDSGEEITPELLEAASVEGVDGEIDLLEMLNSMATKLNYPASAPQESQEVVQETTPAEVHQVLPTVETFNLTEDDFNKAFSSKDGLQEVLGKVVGNSVAAGQQQMMTNISMAVGKVVADSVENYVEFHAVKTRHPIVEQYPEAYRYAVSEVEAVNPEWPRDKILTHAVARLKLYERAAAKQAGKTVDTDDKPGGKPGLGASVRGKRFVKDGGEKNVVEHTRDSLIEHVKAKNTLQAKLGGQTK